MTTRDQIEEEKALILENLGVHITKENLYEKLKMSRATFFRRLREIQDEHAQNLPNDLCAVTTIELYNRYQKRSENYWRHYIRAEERYEELYKQPTPEDKEEKIAYEQALNYLENKVWLTGEKFEEAAKALVYFMKAIGKYNPDIQLNSISQDNSITVVFQGMQKDPPKKKVKEVNPKKGKG